ncbi:nucleotidyl transferase AbiEii/AbiGii toxin family protein [Candidatus Micrarchaeota archaeon]|nr:nucleotidyl transferase AbiEii/AbiGii toxin family protein [Candidatus Micrarchaeota archaeon]
MAEEFKSKEILEKATAALAFLKLLTEYGLKPLFKGGTCAQLFLPSKQQRLSGDIDIAYGNEGEVEATLRKTKKDSYKIMRWPDNPDPNLPFIRYTITAPSKAEFYLDLILKEPKYETQLTKLETAYFSSAIMVRTPTLHSIIGDKLTTLGPSTVGRSLTKERGAIEYAKQVYDIANLLPLASSQAEIYDAYRLVVEDQKIFRPTKPITLENSIEDLLYVARMLTMTGQDVGKLKNKEMARQIDFIKNGMDGIGNFLNSSTKFGPNEARVAGGQIALMAKALEGEGGKRKVDFIKLRENGNKKFSDRQFMEKAIISLKAKEPEIEWKQLANLAPRSVAYWFYALFPEDLGEE